MQPGALVRAGGPLVGGAATVADVAVPERGRVGGGMNADRPMVPKPPAAVRPAPTGQPSIDGARIDGARRDGAPINQAPTETTRPGVPQPSAEWQDDATLAALALTDAEAFGRLYDRYCDQIYRFAYRRLRDREAAEDATADVFFKALRAIGSYKPSVAPFSAWLYRIASNAVTDHLRARRPSQPLDVALDAPDGSDPVDVQAINRLEADRVWLAVDRLSQAQRTAVVLRLGHDLPIAQIAAMMNRSEGAVKLLLNRALTAVRSHLSEPPPPTGERRSGPSPERGIQ